MKTDEINFFSQFLILKKNGAFMFEWKVQTHEQKYCEGYEGHCANNLNKILWEGWCGSLCKQFTTSNFPVISIPSLSSIRFLNYPKFKEAIVADHPPPGLLPYFANSIWIWFLTKFYRMHPLDIVWSWCFPSPWWLWPPSSNYLAISFQESQGRLTPRVGMKEQTSLYPFLPNWAWVSLLHF